MDGYGECCCYPELYTCKTYLALPRFSVLKFEIPFMTHYRELGVLRTKYTEVQENVKTVRSSLLRGGYRSYMS
jgi:hypothetical protein